MFMHKEGAGSIYWLANTDADGSALDGGRDYPSAYRRPSPRRSSGR